MGVTGLTTFLAKHGEKYTEPIYVHNRPVVVDGCNLMFHLYFHGTVTRFSPHLFGGDCIAFGQKVREYFQQLKQCRVLPIVIFDGAYEDGKLRTVMKRFGKSLKENVHNTIPGKSYTSVLIKLVFLEILVEQNIPHFQTEFEADDTIAFVAKKLQSPILSSDSDFFIYSSVTTIPLSTIDCKRVQLKKQEAKKFQMDPNVKPFCLVGKIVTLRELCQKEFKLSDYRLLPLIVVVIGNDQISTKVFSKFHNTKGGGKVKKNDRISFLFKWFGRQRSYESAFNVMLGSVRETERERIREQVTQIVKNYMSDGGEEAVWNVIKLSKSLQDQLGKSEDSIGTEEDQSQCPIVENDKRQQNNDTKGVESTEPESLCDLLQDLDLQDQKEDDNHEDVEQEQDDADDDDFDEDEDEDEDEEEDDSSDLINVSKQVMKLPDWYLEAHRVCSLPTYLIKLFSNRAIFLTPQVEMISSPSSHAVSVPIIQVTGGILCGSATFTLITRTKANVEKINVPTITNLPHSGRLPVVIQDSEDFRSAFPHDKRLKIILEALQITSSADIDFINEWPPFMKFWVATSLYFLRKLRKTNGFFIAVSISLSIIISLLKVYPFPATTNKILANTNSKSNSNAPKNQKKTNNDRETEASLNSSSFSTANQNNNNNDDSDDKKELEKDTTVIGNCETVSNLLKRQCMDAKLANLFKMFDFLPDVKGKGFWRRYDISRVFYFSQYQGIIFHASMLNVLLGNPLRPPKLSALNSHIVYNMCTKITETYYGKVSQFLDKEFDSESPMKLIMIKFIQHALGANDILQCDAKEIPVDENEKRLKKERNKKSRNVDSTQLNRFMFLSTVENQEID